MFGHDLTVSGITVLPEQSGGLCANSVIQKVGLNLDLMLASFRKLLDKKIVFPLWRRHY